jgi:hypothetical protein
MLLPGCGEEYLTRQDVPYQPWQQVFCLYKCCHATYHLYVPRSLGVLMYEFLVGPGSHPLATKEEVEAARDQNTASGGAGKLNAHTQEAACLYHALHSKLVTHNKAGVPLLAKYHTAWPEVLQVRTCVIQCSLRT